MSLIAGSFYHDLYAQFLEFLLYLGIMQNHGRFHRQVAAFSHEHFVIGSVIFAGVLYLAFVHGSRGLFYVPSVCFQAREFNVVESVYGIYQRHGRSSGHIDFVQRPLKDYHVFSYTLRSLSVFRNYQHIFTVDYSNIRIAAFIIVNLKLSGIFKLHSALIFKAVYLRNIIA